MKTSVNIKMDSELRDRAKELFAQIGLDMTTAVNMFIMAALREKGLPFAVTTVSTYDRERLFDEFAASKLQAAEEQTRNGQIREFPAFASDMESKYGL